VKLRVSWVQATQQLSEEGIPDPAIEAEAIMRHATTQDRAGFFASLNEEVDAVEQDQINSLVERRRNREPLFYLLGHREFYGFEIYVDSAVLIPRQETELLVDLTLQHCADYGKRQVTIVDVGTGSGAIALALARHLPAAKIYATDSSREALLVAKTNLETHDLVDRVHLIQTDLLRGLDTTADVIVSNPPYIASGDIASLPIEVQQEPKSAVDGGEEGVELTTRMLKQALPRIRPGGLILFETAPWHIERAIQISRDSFPYARVWQEQDLLGIPRAIMLQMPPTDRAQVHTRPLQTVRGASPLAVV